MLQTQAETYILNQIKSYRGTEFQEFGDRLLSKLYPEEYVAVRAGGMWGDMKNDGYCHLNRTFFHFYSTIQNNVSVLKAKITSDVTGCLENQQQVERIVFVTNDANLGVIEAHIDDLRLKHRIPIDTWGPTRLVEIICALPPKDIAALFNMVLNEDQNPTNIQYVLNAQPYLTWNRTGAKIYALLCILCIIAFPLVCWYGFWPMPFGWWFLTEFLLFGGIIFLSGFVGMVLRGRGVTEFEHSGVFYKKEGKKYTGYQKVAHCPYPHCEGFIVVLEPPAKEDKKRFKLVGCCTVEPEIHTFSYNDNNVGYPIHLSPTKK